MLMICDLAYCTNNLFTGVSDTSPVVNESYFIFPSLQFPWEFKKEDKMDMIDMSDIIGKIQVFLHFRDKSCLIAVQSFYFYY